MSTIRVQLGYNDDAPDPVLPLAVQDRVTAILSELAAIDEALKAGTLDSMALSVGELKVDYSRHIAQLERRGTQLLRELSFLSGLAIAFDRFSKSLSTSVTTVGSSPFSIQSYW